MKYAYDSIKVNDSQAEDIKKIREAFSALSTQLETLCPKGRYLALVETKLEEASMFAVKAITHQAGGYDLLQNKAA